MDFVRMIDQLWNFAVKFAQTIGDIWDWLFEKHVIGFNIKPIENEVFGFLLNWFIDFLNEFSFTFEPIKVFGLTTLTLLGLYLIKTYIPLA